MWFSSKKIDPKVLILQKKREEIYAYEHRRNLDLLYLIPLVLVSILFVLSIPVVAIEYWRYETERPVYEADLPQLLAECRGMIKDRDKFTDITRNGNRKISVSPPNWEWPPTVMKLKAAYVNVCEDHVMICVRAIPSVYLLAFREGEKEYGGKKLIDGLWYSRKPSKDKAVARQEAGRPEKSRKK